MPADAGGEVGRTDAVARFAREELFDEPILERMEGDDDDASAGTEDAHGRRESLLEIRELVVDRDAESLEDARRGVDAARPPRLHAGDETAEIVSHLERRFDAATDDRSRDARRLRLLAVLGEDATKVLFSPGVHDVGRRLAKIRIGTHVEPSSGTEAEAPLVVGQLDRREAEIEDDAVDRSESTLAGQFVQNREIASSEDCAIAETRKLTRGDCECCGIAVESEEPSVWRGRVEDRCGMAAGADGSVEIATSSTRIKLGEDVGDENWLMRSFASIAKSRGPGDRARPWSGRWRARRASVRAPRPRGGRGFR
jgi:hypothetical protein